MTITYEQLFKFMGTFTNEELDDAQVIASYHAEDSSKSYNQILVELLVEMRQAQCAAWLLYWRLRPPLQDSTSCIPLPNSSHVQECSHSLCRRYYHDVRHSTSLDTLLR